MKLFFYPAYPLRVFYAYSTAPAFCHHRGLYSHMANGIRKTDPPCEMGGMIHCGPVQSMLLYTASGSTAATIGGQMKEGCQMPEPYYTCETQT